MRAQQLAVALPVVLLALLISWPVSAQSPRPVEGVWEFAPPEGSSQRGVLIFTGTHYSMMFGRGTEARAQYPDDRRMNEEETVVAGRL